MEKSQAKVYLRRFTHLTLLIALSGILSFSSCSKDETNNSKAPSISNFGVSASDTTILKGSKIEFNPIVDNSLPVTHLWQVNGKEESTTPNFIFEPEEAGRYTIVYSATNEGGTNSKAVNIAVKLYMNGFYIVNDGWFGHENGSVNFFDTDKKELIPNVYQKNNVDLELGVTTCYGTVWNDTFYFISKQGRRVVTADAFTLKDKGSLDEIGGDGRAFAGIDEKTGVITTSEGAYILNLNPLSLGVKLEKTEGQNGSVYVTEKNIFVINQKNGIIAYDIKNNYAIAKEYEKGSVGLVLSKEGHLWAAKTATPMDKSSSLMKIDTETLEVTEIALPSGVSIYNSWGAWNAGSLIASKKENVLYFTKGGSWGGGKEIYRYIIGDETSLNDTFIKSTVGDDSFYGSSIAEDPQTGDIIATFTKDYDYNDNRVVIFDSKTGAEKSRTTFEGYWFPSLVLFN